jgi:PEP-CTERM motif
MKNFQSLKYHKSNRSLFSIFFLAVISFLISTGPASATIIADARGDFFSGVNNGDPGVLSAAGTGTWNYLASDTADPTSDPNGLNGLNWSTLRNSYEYNPSGPFFDSVDLQSAGLASDEIRMHPNSSGSAQYVVTRWITGVGEAGLINITGNVRKVDAGGGNGVTFDLFIDGVSAFTSTTLAFNDTIGTAFNLSATVGVGSTVDFVVGAINNDSNDSTGLKVTISQVPEPTTLALMGLGLIGMGFNRRKRL